MARKPRNEALIMLIDHLLNPEQMRLKEMWNSQGLSQYGHVKRKSSDLTFILLGDRNVGKTCIYQRFVNDKWDTMTSATIGMALGIKNYLYEGRQYKITLRDTGGEERYNSMTTMHFRNADCAILCFDTIETWNRVLFWKNELERNADNCKIIICMTKSDLTDDPDGADSFTDIPKEVEAFLNDNFIELIGVSSKTGKNIDYLFKRAVTLCLSDPTILQRIAEDRKNDFVNIGAAPAPQKSGCCS